MPSAGKEDQRGDGDDDLRHDQRQRDQRRRPRCGRSAAGRAPAPARRRWRSAVEAMVATTAMIDAVERGVADVAVVGDRARTSRQLKPAQTRDQPVGVEGIDDQDQQRRVEEDEDRRRSASTGPGVCRQSKGARRLIGALLAGRCRARMTKISRIATVTTVDSAAPNGQLRDEVNCIWIRLPISSFLPPPSRSGARNEPSAGAKTRLAPASAPGRASGQIDAAEDRGRGWRRDRRRPRSVADRSAPASNRSAAP